MCIPAPRSSAASIIRISRSTPRRPALPRRSKACSRRTRFPGAAQTKAAHADYLAWTEKATPQPGGVNLGEIVVWLRENLPDGCLHHQRRRQFLRLGASLLPLPQIRHPHRADLGLDGLRRAVGARHQARVSRAHGGVLLRRRRLPDERPGVRHRRAIRPADHRRDRRQRHLRHHPHAPGARISDPRGRHRAAAIRTSPPMPRRSAASA